MVRDPERKSTPNGAEFCKLTVACQRKYKNEEGRYDADFINCVAWSKTAEVICNYFTKGQKIAIEGKLKNNPYTDKDGNKRTFTEVEIDTVEFVTPASHKEPVKDDSNENAFDGYDEISDGELPF